MYPSNSSPVELLSKPYAWDKSKSDLSRHLFKKKSYNWKLQVFAKRIKTLNCVPALIMLLWFSCLKENAFSTNFIISWSSACWFIKSQRVCYKDWWKLCPLWSSIYCYLMYGFKNTQFLWRVAIPVTPKCDRKWLYLSSWKLIWTCSSLANLPHV